MSALLHVLSGVALWPLLGWRALLLAVPVHIILDFACRYHPPGMVWPWGKPNPWGKVYAVVMDGWAYSEFGTRTYADCLDHDQPLREMILLWSGILWWVNVAGGLALAPALAFKVISWQAVVVGLAFWLLCDCWWLVQALAPATFARWFWPWNPHRIADWLRARLWPRLNNTAAGAAFELALIAAATVAAVAA